MQNPPDPRASIVTNTSMNTAMNTVTNAEPTDEGFSVQQLAAAQVQHVLVATNNLISTMIFLLSSAFALVAALAWNKAISDWLPTVNFFDLTNPIAKDFAYALIATLFAIIIIGVLGVINARLKGKNLLVQEPPK